MIGAVHVVLGAAVGALARNKPTAFLAGVVSHALTDALPHKDYDPIIEIPLLGAALAGITIWKGADSPEFWGAVGGIAPDVEHALSVAGLIASEHKIFPTHVQKGRYHGRESGNQWSQAVVTAASLLALLTADRDRG